MLPKSKWQSGHYIYSMDLAVPPQTMTYGESYNRGFWSYLLTLKNGVVDPLEAWHSPFIPWHWCLQHTNLVTKVVRHKSPNSAVHHIIIHKSLNSAVHHIIILLIYITFGLWPLVFVSWLHLSFMFLQSLHYTLAECPTNSAVWAGFPFPKPCSLYAMMPIRYLAVRVSRWPMWPATFFGPIFRADVPSYYP